ncbi:50S ribosomal protein L37ae [Candidatus Pacearchaeota archaeon]|nr:50S ribosomal protein L37ae [Candidatus Pacearchaeota archaeon]
MERTKKVKQAGKFGAGYGRKVREGFVSVESRQRKKQVCPFCKSLKARRKSAGIWKCKKCGKKFASGAYYLAR